MRFLCGFNENSRSPAFRFEPSILGPEFEGLYDLQGFAAHRGHGAYGETHCAR
jgi:hypothetical protein